jgi:ATP-dependent Clp protease ATP-binding subunit ClpA/ActR/RegA family two-component response regulator
VEAARPVSASELAAYFSQKIIGQPKAAERIIPFIQTFQAGLTPANRPVGVFLLLGPTGTGKTRTVEVLAEALHGSAQKYLRIDCGEYQLDHEVAKLIGAPPGYHGHRETVPVLSKQKLADAITPHCDIALVLIDEIEKAAPALARLLLGMLDTARLTLGDNSVVNFDNALIFMTSNLGAREMMREMTPTFGFGTASRTPGEVAEIAGKLEAIALAAVRKMFSPEFVNRIDAVITYQPLSSESISRVLDNQIEELQHHVNSRLGARCFSIELTDAAREFLLSRGVSAEYGARELKRTVYRHLTQPLATMVAENQVPSGSSVIVHANADNEVLKFQVRAGDSTVSGKTKPVLLIVDDNETLLKYLRAVTSNEGWELMTATSAVAAIQEAEKRSFDVALIDYMLPDLDGAALSKKLQEMLPSIKLVLMTGGGEMVFSQQSGLAHVPVIQKPFVVDDLLNLLRNQFGEESSEAASAASA